jgi:hypothetical protein
MTNSHGILKMEGGLRLLLILILISRVWVDTGLQIFYMATK